MKISYIFFKNFTQLLFSMFVIGLIVVGTVCLRSSNNDFLQTFIEQFKLLINSLVNINELTVQIGSSVSQPFWNFLEEPYQYSLIILTASFICTFIFGIILSYGMYLLPKNLQKFVKECLFVIQSIPDVMFIFMFQLLIIWIYKQTNFLLIDPIAGKEKVYALPIIFVSLLPGIMLFQMTFLAIEEESKKMYVEYAKAKGLSNGCILLKHIMRNVMVTLLSNSQFLFWMIISNQLVIEYLFNIHGYFYYLYQLLDKPNVFYICILILFVPFYVLETIFNYFSLNFSGKERVE